MKFEKVCPSMLSAFLICSPAWSLVSKPDASRMLPTGAPAGWVAGLRHEEVKPFVSEGIMSTLLWAARSPKGSYVFLSWVDHTTKRGPLTVGDLDGMIGPETYRGVAPTSVAKGHGFLATEGGDGLETLWVRIEALGSGYDFTSARTTPTLAKNVFVPAYLRKGTEVVNWMFVISFRGPVSATDDLQAFEALCKGLRLPSPDLRAVYATRAETVVASTTVVPVAKAEQSTAASASTPPAVADTVPTEEILAEAMLLVAAKSETLADATGLQASAAPMRGAAAATVAATLVRDAMSRADRRVWQAIVEAKGPSGATRDLALRFLVAAWNMRDVDLLKDVGAWLDSKELGMAQLTEEETRRVVLGMEACRPAGAPERSALQHFWDLTRQRPEQAKWLLGALEDRKVHIPSLTLIGHEGPTGVWQLTENPATGVPILVTNGGRVGLLQPKVPGRPKSGCSFTPLNDFSQLATKLCAQEMPPR